LLRELRGPEREAGAQLEAREATANAFLMAARVNIEAGDSFALMEAVRLCLLYRLSAPKWLLQAFERGIAPVAARDLNSWDEAFGTPFPSGTHLAAVKKRDRTARALFAELIQRASADSAFEFGRAFEELAGKPGFPYSAKELDDLSRRPEYRPLRSMVQNLKRQTRSGEFPKT
jgi:hypothetical protein